jgi:hypothetical protein
MKHISKVAALGALGIAVLLPTSAHAAEGQCTDPASVDYCSPGTPSGGGVLPSESEQGGGGSAGGPATAEQTPSGVPVGAPAAAETTPAAAPSGSLPFTGGDVVGMTIIGAGALGLGTVLVRRTKKTTTA